MKSLLLTLISAASLVSGAALADGRISATLANPNSGAKQVIAFHSVWNCAGGACVAQVAPDDAQTVSGCKELAHEVGALTAYAGDTKTLDAAGLAKCNTAAAPPPVIGTASR